MSIFDETGQHDPITEGGRALALFTDRHEAIRLFSSFLNDNPPHKRILFFYGDGGNGKSLLLRFLRRNYSKRLSAENWEYIRDKADEEFAWHLKNAAGAEPVTCASLDFGMKPVGEDRPQEPFSALLMLRRALAHSARGAGRRLRFPLYDFACVWYLHKTNVLNGDRLRDLFPAEEMEFLGEMVNVVGKTSAGTLGKAVLNLFGKHARAWLALYGQRRRLDEEQVQRIQGMDPESELVAQLPLLFAEDLNVSLSMSGAPEKILLLFDTHDAFWGHQRNLAPELFFERDEWLRSLLGALELSAGVVAVVAGRERPRWAEASRCRIPEEFLEPFLVGHLSEADATSYLERAGVAGAALRQSIVAYARVMPSQVHPLHLGLCADVALAASAKDEALTPEHFRVEVQKANKDEELIRRLLSYVDVEVNYAVRALCACRAFDAEIYLRLGRALNFPATEPAFRGVLIQFSFVWQSQQRGRGWYRIHELIRRLLQGRGDELTRRAHEELEKHYRERGEAGDVTSAAEAIYHTNRLNWGRGVDQWVEAFEAALQASNYGICRALLGIRPELLVETCLALGLMSQLEGDYFKSLALYEEAAQHYLGAIKAYGEQLRHEPGGAFVYYSRGVALKHLGDLQSELSQHDAAARSYVDAIADYDKALALAPGGVPALSGKGLALQSLGDLQLHLSLHKAAVASYAAAVEVCREAVRLAPGYLPAHNSKGLALQSLGELQAALSGHESAITNFAAAVETYEAALRLAPDHVRIHNNKGLALANLGDSQAALSRHEAAAASYTAAAAAFDGALQRAPDYIAAHNNKGNTLAKLGELRAALSQHKAAAAGYAAAIAAYDAALGLAPDYVLAHHNRGNALTRLGELQAELTDYKAAAASYAAAVEACDEALQRSPDYVIAHNSKGLALAKLGELQAAQSQHGSAITSYTAAAEAYDAALRLAPEYVTALSNKGNALLTRGNSRAALSQYTAAAESYKAAIAAYDEALALAPDYVPAHCNKGITLAQLGDMQAGLSEYKAATASYRAAVAASDEALRRASDYLPAYNNKGNALQGLGDLQARQSLHDAALKSYAAAISAYDAVLRFAPDNVVAHNNKGNTLSRLGTLQAALALLDAALASFRAAVAELDRSLEIAPGDERVRRVRDEWQKLVEEWR